MANTYRVVDLRADVVDPMEFNINDARSAEDAARQVLGEDVVRSGQRKDLLARVYWQTTGQPVTMVRLYRRLAD